MILPYLAYTSTRFCKSWHGDRSWQKEHFKHTVVMGNKVITIYGLLEVLRMRLECTIYDEQTS